MTSWDGAGNPNPGDVLRPDEYAERECPFCGATVKKLPNHLRRHCEAKP